MDNDIIPSLTTAEVRGLSTYLFMLGPAEFRAALGLEDDAYADEKYTDFKKLAQALARVSPSQLVDVLAAGRKYVAS